MRETAIVRQVSDALVWYPPGGDGARPVDAAALEQLAGIASTRRNGLVFAVPGPDVQLQEMSISSAEKRHIGKSLPFLLEDQFAGDVEELHVASAFLNKLELAVASCDRELMSEWHELLEDLPAIGQWVPEPLLLPWRQGEVCILIEEEQVLVRSGECAGFAVEKQLAPAWLESLDVDSIQFVVVYSEDEAVGRELIPDALQDRMQWRTGDFSAALMLAEDGAPPVNLLQGDYGPSLPLERWWHEWRLPLSLLLAAFLAQVGSSYADFRRLENENLLLRQQMEASYREVVPRGAVSDPEKQLQRKLSGQKAGSNSAGFMVLMEQIGRVVSKQDGALIASVNFTDKVGDVRLNLYVPDFKAVESIRAGLAAEGLQAELENSNAQGEGVRARLKVGER